MTSTSDPVQEALVGLRVRLAELEAEEERVSAAISALEKLTQGDAAVVTVAPGPRPSVRRMLVSLLEEGDRDWSAKEILAEYESRGTPVHGTRPENSLRAAMVDANRADEIRRTTQGRYKATKWARLGLPGIAAEVASG